MVLASVAIKAIAITPTISVQSLVNFVLLLERPDDIGAGLGDDVKVPPNREAGA